MSVFGGEGGGAKKKEKTTSVLRGHWPRGIGGCLKSTAIVTDLLASKSITDFVPARSLTPPPPRPTSAELLPVCN